MLGGPHSHFLGIDGRGAPTRAPRQRDGRTEHAAPPAKRVTSRGAGAPHARRSDGLSATGRPVSQHGVRGRRRRRVRTGARHRQSVALLTARCVQARRDTQRVAQGRKAVPLRAKGAGVWALCYPNPNLTPSNMSACEEQGRREGFDRPSHGARWAGVAHILATGWTLGALAEAKHKQAEVY